MTGSDNTTCVITGALGFLGSRIAAEFEAAGYRVVGLGRECVPADGLDSHHLAAYSCVDLPSDELERILAQERPAVIVHAAGPASVVGSMEDPAADFAGTVGVLAALLDAVRRVTPHSAVLILSSAAVYGDPASLPVSESAPVAPVSPYGFHKAMAETLLAEYSSVFGVPTAALRVFSAYGAGLRRQILWDVCEKAAADPVVRLFGTGAESRDFVHAADVAQAARLVAERGALRGEAYNVAAGEETTIRSLAERLATCVRPDATIEFTGVERAGDPSRWVADIGRLSALGFAPRVALDDGIAEYCTWYGEVAGERA